MKKTIKDLNIKGKKVIIRCDFNVPMENGKITSDYRIKASLPTINYAVKQGCKVILLSHLGRIKNEEDLMKYSLKPVSRALSKMLDCKVSFCSACNGTRAKNAIRKMKKGSVLLLENTRFLDIDCKRESGNDDTLASEWASYADFFIDDAFSVAHRKHASNVGIAKHLPSAMGLLMLKEINYLSRKPKHPYIVMLGGSKVSDKIGIIDSLASKADYLLIGGAMAFTFLRATGFDVGLSLVEKDYLDYCVEVLHKYEDKIILPIDVVTALEISENADSYERFINEIGVDEIGLDIGNRTIKVFKQYIDSANTIFWNGPMGYDEIKKFSNGTKKLLKIVTDSNALVTIGGGDTAAYAINMGYEDKISHISTGGGASLEFLEGKVLPGIDVIDEK